MNILVISPHPDDEVLGMGGTIKKLSKKNRIILCVVSEGATAQYKDKKMIQVRRNACKKCSKILGISKTIFLDFPDMRLNLSHLDINKKLEEIIKEFKPEVVYTAPRNDLNLDHQSVFDSTLVACRPKSGVKKYYAMNYRDAQKRHSDQIFLKILRMNLILKLRDLKCINQKLKSFQTQDPLSRLKTWQFSEELKWD